MKNKSNDEIKMVVLRKFLIELKISLVEAFNVISLMYFFYQVQIK